MAESKREILQYKIEFQVAPEKRDPRDFTCPNDVAHYAVEESGVKQEDIARHLEMSKQLLSQKLNGATNNVTCNEYVRIARALGTDAGHVTGYCLGEHGDSQVPALSTVTVDGRPLDAEARAALAPVCRETVGAGWEIATRKGCTEFGIGAAAARLIGAILGGEEAEMACSVMLNGEYGGRGVYAGIPCAVGKGGAEPLPEFDLTQEELAALQRSFEVIGRHAARALRG